MYNGSSLNPNAAPRVFSLETSPKSPLDAPSVPSYKSALASKPAVPTPVASQDAADSGPNSANKLDNEAKIAKNSAETKSKKKKKNPTIQGMSLSDKIQPGLFKVKSKKEKKAKTKDCSKSADESAAKQSVSPSISGPTTPSVDNAAVAWPLMSDSGRTHTPVVTHYGAKLLAPKSSENFIEPKQLTTAKSKSTTKQTKQPSPKKQKSQPVSPAKSIDVSPKVTPYKPSNGLLGPKQARTLDMSGGEHDLLRLLHTGKLVIQNRGRQRIKPRTKKFSILKKKVLDERLRMWKELNEGKIDSNTNNNDEGTELGRTVCLFGFADEENVTDEDEYAELCDNLRELSRNVAQDARIYIPQTPMPNSFSLQGYPAFVQFQHSDDAKAALSCWQEISVGGSILHTRLLHSDAADQSDEDWQKWCLDEIASDKIKSDDDFDESPVTSIQLNNALTSEDFEDEECLEECVSDIKTIAESLGPVASIEAFQDPSPHIIIDYSLGPSETHRVVAEFNKITIAGNKVRAKIVNGDSSDEGYSIALKNILSDDDLEDEECLEETLEDVRELAEKYGKLLRINTELDGGNSKVIVCYADKNMAEDAFVTFDGLCLGGNTVRAKKLYDAESTLLSIGAVSRPETTAEDKKHGPNVLQTKRIPDRFAACLSVPKIVSQSPRDYAKVTNDDNLKQLLTTLLGELMRLQQKALIEKNTKVKRRLVLGLREVAKRIKARKVKLVVMANNMDEYGAIDAKLSEILELAKEEDIPVFFEFSKRQLGKAVGKNIKVSIVAVQNPEGAYQEFKKIMKIASKVS